MITELARVQVEAQKLSYEENDLEEYEFIAEPTACPICKAIDGKHFKVAKMLPGENAPPMHPYCRCSTAPYSDRKEFDEWLDGHKDHGLSYADWKSKRHNVEKQYLNAKKMGNLSRATYDKIKAIVEEGLKRYPKKVQSVLKDYTFEIGGNVNACDTINKIIKLAPDANLYILDHEIGHMMEEIIINKRKLDDLKRKILYGKTKKDIMVEIRYDAEGNPVPVLYVKDSDFFTDYQGRLYSEKLDDFDELFDSNGRIRPDRAWEIIAETLPHYMLKEKAPNITIQKIYDLIKESME